MKLSHLLVLSTALVFTGAIAQQAVAPANPETVPVVAVDTGPVKPGDPKAGQAKAGACAACHGVDGNAAIALYPKLAGQHEQYIWRQLKMYKSGERNNAIMLGLAAVLTEQDMRDIGAYFSQQKVIAGLADETVIAQGPNAGKKFYEVEEKNLPLRQRHQRRSGMHGLPRPCRCRHARSDISRTRRPARRLHQPASERIPRRYRVGQGQKRQRHHVTGRQRPER